jgi:protein-disulfide isomerase
MRLYAIALAALLPLLAAGPDNIQGNAFGDPGAPIRIEVFSDFQCPACKRLHEEELPMIMKDFVTTGKVYVIYRYYPLPMHAYARPAAELVCAAAQLGKYREAADVLFARQSSWSVDGKVEETVAGVLTAPERKKLKGLVRDAAVERQINRDLAEGAAVPVKSTPTLLVTYGMKRYPISGEGALNYRLLKSFLDSLLPPSPKR